MNEQKKPLIIEIEEAKAELMQCVNDILKRHNINCYLFEPTFANMYSQIKLNAQQELAQAKAQTEAAKAASECACGHNNTK